MKGRRRIVYCEGNLDGTIGGSYFSLLFLVAGLNREQFEPIVVFRRTNALMEKFQDAGVEVVVFPPPEPVRLGLPRDTSRLPIWLRPIVVVRQGINFLRVFAWDGLKLAWWLRKKRVDLVHLNNSVTRTHSWMLAAKFLGIPCITHERGMNTRYSSISLYFAPRLAKVVCISRAVRDNLLHHGVTKDNLVVIYNGIDPDQYRPTLTSSEVRRQLGIAPDAPVVGMVGNIRAWKGQEVVVRAIGDLREKYPGLACLLVGTATESDSGFLEHLQKLAIRLNVADNLIWTGYQREAGNFTNAMDVVIHASTDPEPFGRVIIEAMALGKPVVGAAAGAVPEILNEPECGLTFPPGDHRVLASMVDRLLKDKALARRMGDAGKQRVKYEFHVSANIERTERVYREVLG